MKKLILIVLLWIAFMAMLSLIGLHGLPFHIVNFSICFFLLYLINFTKFFWR